MLIDILKNALSVLYFAWPGLVLPIIIGPIILRRYRDDGLSGLAGVFTFKPVVATPIWALLFAVGDTLNLPTELAPVLLLLPGIVLTLAIVWAFRRSFRTETGIALLLLAVDPLRWLSSYAVIASGNDVLGTIYFPAALILPNAYAVMALVIMLLRRRQRRRASDVSAPPPVNTRT